MCITVIASLLMVLLFVRCCFSCCVVVYVVFVCSRMHYCLLFSRSLVVVSCFLSDRTKQPTYEEATYRHFIALNIIEQCSIICLISFNII